MDERLAVLRLPLQYKALRFHPDGMIVGCASASGEVFVWDVKSFEQRAALPMPKDGASLTALAFSENGYYMATACADSTVSEPQVSFSLPLVFACERQIASSLRLLCVAVSLQVQLWDLRKSLVFETLNVSREGESNAAGGGGSCTNVCFDSSGLSLAASSSLGFVSLFNFEGRAHVAQVGILEGHSGAVMDTQCVADENDFTKVFKVFFRQLCVFFSGLAFTGSWKRRAPFSRLPRTKPFASGRRVPSKPRPDPSSVESLLLRH